MSRKTKEELEQQLNAATLRANRVTINLNKLRAGIAAVMGMAEQGHLGGEDLLDALEDVLSDEGTPPSEVETEYSIYGRSAR